MGCEQYTGRSRAVYRQEASSVQGGEQYTRRRRAVYKEEVNSIQGGGEQYTGRK